MAPPGAPPPQPRPQSVRVPAATHSGGMPAEGSNAGHRQPVVRRRPEDPPADGVADQSLERPAKRTRYVALNNPDARA